MQQSLAGRKIKCKEWLCGIEEERRLVYAAQQLNSDLRKWQMTMHLSSSNDGSECEKDPENQTFSASFSTIFKADGSLTNFQRQKYQPSVDLLVQNGLKHDSSVLDVGVGYGAFLVLLEQLGFRSTMGMDPFPKSIEITSRVVKQATLFRGRVEDDCWPFEPESLDCITSFDVIEHLEEPSLFLDRAHTYLRSGGLFLFSTPLKELGYRLRRIPWVGIPDRNPTHINVHPPKFWLQLANNSALSTVTSWRGENLSHIKGVNRLGRRLIKWGIDPGKIPVLRSLEQSFLVLLKKQ